jgi:hypothetical protein
LTADDHATYVAIEHANVAAFARRKESQRLTGWSVCGSSAKTSPSAPAAKLRTWMRQGLWHRHNEDLDNPSTRSRADEGAEESMALQSYKPRRRS